MAERRDQERGQWGNPSEKATGVGAPGSTGAFQTSDPLGAPGSTGASLTNQDPTAIPTRARAAGSDYEEPDMEYGGGGQQQQLRHPTSGDYGGGQQLRHPTSGDYGGRQQHQLHGPTSGIGQHQQELRDPTSGVYGGGQHQQQLRDPTSGVIGSGDEFERDRAGHGPVGVTGFTKVATTTTAPGEDVIHGRETVTRAEELGSAAGAGRDEKGVVEKARELKGRVQGGAHHR